MRSSASSRFSFEPPFINDRRSTEIDMNFTPNSMAAAATNMEGSGRESLAVKNLSAKNKSPLATPMQSVAELISAEQEAEI